MQGRMARPNGAFTVGTLWTRSVSARICGSQSRRWGGGRPASTNRLPMISRRLRTGTRPSPTHHFQSFPLLRKGGRAERWRKWIKGARTAPHMPRPESAAGFCAAGSAAAPHGRSRSRNVVAFYFKSYNDRAALEDTWSPNEDLRGTAISWLDPAALQLGTSLHPRPGDERRCNPALFGSGRAGHGSEGRGSCHRGARKARPLDPQCSGGLRKPRHGLLHPGTLPAGRTGLRAGAEIEFQALQCTTHAGNLLCRFGTRERGHSNPGTGLQTSPQQRDWPHDRAEVDERLLIPRYAHQGAGSHRRNARTKPE